MSRPLNIMVTGASGHLGQLVVQELIRSSKNKIFAGSRNLEKIKAFADSGVTLRSLDFTAPSTLKDAFKGIDRLLLISTDAVGARVEQHKNAIEAAKAAGVKHIIYTSWPSPENSLAGVGPDHFQTEVLIQQSGMTYTLLRNFLYMDNFLHTLKTAIQMKTLFGAGGEGKAAYVSREDCALAAASALDSDRFVNSMIDVSGPRALSYKDVAALASEILGVPIAYHDLSAEDFSKALVESGLPEQWANLYVSFDLAIKQGELSIPSSGVKSLTGKNPKDIREFIIENKKSLRV